MHNPGNTTHGLSQNPLYGVWYSMIDRCYNAKHQYFKDYGGRGITVCNEWRYSVAAFIACVGPTHSPGLIFDRRDNDGDYEPTNWKWSTSIESMNNTRTNVALTAFGSTMTLAQWSRDPRCVVSYNALRRRKHDLGWDDESAISTPLKDSHFLTAFDPPETKTMGEWVNDPRCAIGYAGLKDRVKRGWDDERAITEPRRSNRYY